ncbi:hypothetical protein OXX69_001961 [Metschnikowia pulcherrima]
MSESEHTCRICRGEASLTQPLMHPCKCRGSIKYIHQECLLEWLEHSNNKAKRCDICNTPYRFVTLYDPDMPAKMPLADIYTRLLVSMKNAAVRHIAAGLYVLCVAQIPVYWKFVGRLCTYAADGKMPSPNFSLFHIMAYGAYPRTRNGHSFASADATAWDKFATFLFNTYLNGVVQVLVFMLVLFVIFIEHEWVVREEGYTKSLLRHIGKEPKTKLADLLGSMVENAAEDGDNSLAALALEYLQQDAQAPFPGNPLREALDNGQFDELFHNLAERPGHGGAERPEHGGRDELLAAPSNDSSGWVSEDELSDSARAHDVDSVDGEGTVDLVGDSFTSSGENRQNAEDSTNNTNDILGAHVGAPLNADPQTGNPNADPPLNANPHQGQIPNADGNNAPLDSDEEPAEELERRRNIAEDEMAVAEAANNNGNILEVLGLRLQIATPIQLTFLLNAATLVLLFLVYFFPHILGSSVALVLSYALVGFEAVFILPLKNTSVFMKAQQILQNAASSKLASHPYVVSAGNILLQHFVDPVWTVWTDVTVLQRIEPPRYAARIVFLAIGYSVVCFAVYSLMAALRPENAPITGTARKLYKLLFQLTATAKVFAIFAIEIVLFPVYCGWLLDFCLAPLLVSKITESTDSGVVYRIFFTSAYSLTSQVFIRFVLYWMWGTGYMFCIALFVSMARSHILRPGVLYFIKSPEDPNARLIHDAVVKPFFLQMSRIFLSAKVYSAFVVFGIGFVTWGVRFLVNPPWAPGALLPIRISFYVTAQTAFLTGSFLYKAQPLLSKYCRIFWQRAFAVLCHKLRLSHFILGSPVPQERGYIVYRNILDSVLQLSQPDYTKPVSYSEAMSIFKNDPSVKACFVPNGSYIRAPNSDDNSRKFLRQLFVPVTKSDQLISPLEEFADDDTDWWDADVVCEDTYTVVYSPPNVRLRCLALVSMVSVFGALIFVVAFTAAVMVGRPPFRLCVTVIDAALSVIGMGPKDYEKIDWAFADVDSICMGILLLVGGLACFDGSPDASALLEFGVQQGNRWGAMAFIPRSLVSVASLIVLSAAQCWFCFQIHCIYVAHLEKSVFGTAMISTFNGTDVTLHFTWAGLVLHTLTCFLTIIPFARAIHHGAPERRSFKSWAKKVGLLDMLLSIAILLAHTLFQIFSSRPDYKHAREIVVGSIVCTRLILGSRRLIKSISEQIKTEKYVRGTAVQNVDVADE